MLGRYGVRLAVFAVAAGFTCASAWLPTAAMAAADPDKVIRWYFRTGESGFDPVRVSDLNSATVIEAIFERLLTYDYLARPARLSPMAAEGLPEITDNGRTYTFRIRKGVYFAPDPAFKGKQRELTAQDFVYSYLRFMDPKNRAPYAFLLAGKLVGLDELAERAKKTGRFDYDAPVAGIKAVDRHTLRFQLKDIDYNFSYVAAHASFGAWRARSSRPMATTSRRTRSGPVRTDCRAGSGARRSCSRPTPSIAGLSGISSLPTKIGTGR